MSIQTQSKLDKGVEINPVNSKPGFSLPPRVYIGYFLTICLLIAPAFFGGKHLNSVTISLQVFLYLFWAIGITLLHKDIKAIASDYQFGPKESMVGALVPFSYIFWNFHWVSEMWKELGLGAFSFRNNNHIVGLIAALASCACFPDNLDKIPQVVPVFGFILLFTLTWIFTNRIESLKGNRSFSPEALNIEAE